MIKFQLADEVVEQQTPIEARLEIDSAGDLVLRLSCDGHEETLLWIHAKEGTLHRCTSMHAVFGLMKDGQGRILLDAEEQDSN